MLELSLHILDIARNSIKANSTMVNIDIIENDDFIEFTIEDNGKGMSKDKLNKVIDPFYTTRTTRKVGLGLPLLKMHCELANGKFSIESVVDKGTKVFVKLYKDSINTMPLGNIEDTILAIINNEENVDIDFNHFIKQKSVNINTKELKDILEVDNLFNPQILMFLQNNIKDQYKEAAL